MADTQLHPGRWYSQLEDGRFQCELCPRYCKLRPGQRAFCFVRMATEEGIALTTYGRSSGFCIDPIEKKPLNHFLPGTPILSFGTAGCNLGCKFCQNWDISKAKKQDRLMDSASPLRIAQAAHATSCRSVAFTYNDPVIFAEYAIDIAAACREVDIHTVAVTAGYITDRARPEFYAAMDAANIDLKAFTESFYKKLCYGELGPVLDTLKYAVNETDTWVEITNLLIPDANDGDAELHAMTNWIREELGPDVPLHFTAFHPDFRMKDRGRTPAATLTRARSIAKENGLNYVYTGNVHDSKGGSTTCPKCDHLLVERDWYVLGAWGLRDGACESCGTKIPGNFEDRPGTWGAKRKRVRLGR